MRILHTFAFYEPSKGGAQEVIKQLSERLAKRGHQMTIATAYLPGRRHLDLNGVDIQQFRISGNAVKGIAGEIEAYQNFLLRSEFDVMLNYAAQTWTTDLVLPLLNKIRAAKFIVPLGYSKLYERRYQRYFRTLPSFLKEYDKILYTSVNYRDKLFGDSHGLGPKALVIPNGASEEEFSRHPLGFREKYGITTKYMFLSVSNHYLAKGHQFLLKAFRGISSNECTLVLIGQKPQEHTWYNCYPLCSLTGVVDKRIKILRGVSREWVISAYQEADLFLFSSKVECAPLVMYESFASKTPFITTNVGNITDHKDVVRIVNSPAQMSAEIRAFLEDPSYYRDLADKAHRMFLESHRWEQLVQKYEDLYTEELRKRS